MTFFRLAFIAIFSLLGAACIGIVLLIFFTSGTPASITKQLNNTFFQVKADAEVDKFIQNGVFTKSQESDIRGFVRRLYISDCAILIYGLGAGILALGISFLSIAHSFWISFCLSTLSRRLKAEQGAAANP